VTLNDVWFFLFILIIAGYLILDGFDMGVGILLLPMARTDTERRILLNSIGPVWDGNEVWLVLGAGVLFAVFPLAYASLFSGLYLAFVLVLLVMILRTVALEFRSKEPGRHWRSAWDTVFAVASTGLAFLLGLAFGNIIDGLPLDAQGKTTHALLLALFDEDSGEWLPASELAAKQAAAGAADDVVEVRDAVGNLLADGDAVTLIKDLDVKGAGQTLKRGTLIPSIRLTGDAQEIDCKYPGIKGLVLRAEFVKKR
jgi:alkylphosphonate utilization operon protein PhnA